MCWHTLCRKLIIIQLIISLNGGLQLGVKSQSLYAMERSWTEDLALVTDGGADIRGKSASNQQLSTVSSGHFVDELASSLYTDTLDWSTSPRISSYDPDQHVNVKWHFSDTTPVRPAEVFQDLKQSDFGWTTNEIGEERSLTANDASSLLYMTVDDQAYILTKDTIQTPAAHYRQLKPASSATSHTQQPLSSSWGTETYTSTGDQISPSSDRSLYSVANDWAHPSACTNNEANLEPSQSLEPRLNISLCATVSTDISKAQGESIIADVTDTSSPILDDPSVIPLDTSVLTEASQSLHVTELTPDKTLSEITWGFGDTIHFITSTNIVETNTGAPCQPHAATYLTPSNSLGYWNLDVGSQSILEDNDSWLRISQLTNIRNTSDWLPSVTSKLPAVNDSVSSRATPAVVPRRTFSQNLENTVLFTFSTLTSPDASFGDYLLAYSDQLLTTSVEDSQQVTHFEAKLESDSSIAGTRPAHPEGLSVVKSWPPTPEAVDIVPSHSTGNYRLSQDTSRIMTHSMEISTSSALHLQPSSTVVYHSISDVSSRENDNTKNVAEVFNDLHAETVSHQPLSSHSPTINQVVTEDTTIHPTRSLSVDPASTVSVSSSMFISWEKSGHASSTLWSVTNGIHSTGPVTTTQKMNISDGETSSRQVPSFNTTIIIASACAVLALVILVVITICCLRRRRRSKSSSSRQEGDDLWVDLYRSNSSHQMPLPSLTTCPSTFEMRDILKSSSTEDIPDNKNKDGYTPEEGSSVMRQMKPQGHISSFQIKNPKLEVEQELKPTYPTSELGFSEDHAEHWVKMATSLSMTSLPTTELSYHTNVTDYNLAAVGQKFRAVYNYKPVCKGEMALKEGELVECKERDRNGWMLGYKPRTNEEGWFPAVYVDELSSDDELDFTCEVPETYDILESNKLNSTDQYWTGIEHQVCYSYHSSVPGDLDIEVGQVVIVLQTLANGWWFAVSGNKCGWFPGSYVEMIIDNTEEQPSNDSWCELDGHTSVRTEAQDITAVQTIEDKSDTTNASLSRISELPEEKEGAHEDQKKNEITNETLSFNVSISTVIQAGENNELKESTGTLDTSEINSTVLSMLNDQTAQKAIPHSTGGLISATGVHTDKSPLSQKRLENSLRPVRPAPPPPKPRDSKVKKDSNTSADSNSKLETSKPQDLVFKKPVTVIHGKRPKLHKVLRCQLDEKRLSPMIRPSTRGFIPKPTAYRHNGLNNEYRSTAEHAHSSQSIIYDLHSERTMFSQADNSASHMLPFQFLNFRPITQQDYKSSKSSLESHPESRLVYPRGSTPHSEQDKVNPSNISSYFSHERSLTPDYRRERSITPDFKRDRSNSPLLLTTGNLLQNVQRFHGALKHPIPSGSDKRSLKGLSAEKREMDLTQVNTSANTLSTFSRQQRPAPTTIPHLKTPSQKSLHNQQPFSTPHDQNSEKSSVNIPCDNESLNKYVDSEKMLPTNTLPICGDNVGENTSNIKQYPSKCPNSDNTAVHMEPFIVTPGTVSEIVQQINKQLPLQTELLQKLKSDRRQPEPTDISSREDLLAETDGQKLAPTDQGQNTFNNSFKDVTFNDKPTTAL